MGAWIEIPITTTSLTIGHVAPFVGAWIEMASEDLGQEYYNGRSLRGSVD